MILPHSTLIFAKGTVEHPVQFILNCALGKEWHRSTQAVVKGFPPIYRALKSEKKKVVVIAHSQGTIILAKILWLLKQNTQRAVHGKGRNWEQAQHRSDFFYPDRTGLNLRDFEELTEQEWAKLELYCFATCADSMLYYRRPSKGVGPIPWIEHFGNEYDLIARLGMLAPHKGQLEIQLDGPIYRRPGIYGHLLNQHYLSGIEQYQMSKHHPGGIWDSAPFELLNAEKYPDASRPRLYSYLDGGSPQETGPRLRKR